MVTGVTRNFSVALERGAPRHRPEARPSRDGRVAACWRAAAPCWWPTPPSPRCPTPRSSPTSRSRRPAWRGASATSRASRCSPSRPSAIRRASARSRCRRRCSILDAMHVDFEYDGEMAADVALNRERWPPIRSAGCPDTANVLVMPAFHSASISTQHAAGARRRDRDRPADRRPRPAGADRAARRARTPTSSTWRRWRPSTSAAEADLGGDGLFHCRRTPLWSRPSRAGASARVAAAQSLRAIRAAAIPVARPPSAGRRLSGSTGMICASIGSDVVRPFEVPCGPDASRNGHSPSADETRAGSAPGRATNAATAGFATSARARTVPLSAWRNHAPRPRRCLSRRSHDRRGLFQAGARPGRTCRPPRPGGRRRDRSVPPGAMGQAGSRGSGRTPGAAGRARAEGRSRPGGPGRRQGRSRSGRQGGQPRHPGPEGRCGSGRPGRPLGSRRRRGPAGAAGPAGPAGEAAPSSPSRCARRPASPASPSRRNARRASRSSPPPARQAPRWSQDGTASCPAPADAAAGAQLTVTCAK